MAERLKIAFAGARHFHAMMFLNTIKKMPHEIVAIADVDTAFIEEKSAAFGCRGYNDYKVMLDTEKPDFVFSFGKHRDMAGILKEILARNIPVCTEKPITDDPDTMRSLAETAKKNGIYTDVALPLRFSPILLTINAFREKHDIGKVVHCYFRNMAGPVQRYVDWGNAWMIDKELALGGPFMNEGAHYIDLFLQIAGQPITSSIGFTTNHIYGGSIDDNTTVVMNTADGTRCVIEICYGYPTSNNWRDLACVVNTENYLFTLLDREEPREFALEIRSRIDNHVETVDLLPYEQRVYRVFTEETLNNFISGKAGIVPFDYYCGIVDVLASVYGKH
ncbi:Gfo/Idh/MocA family oxidoreductase [bacterium]|nr:Gfo/Idh/MocA family oxidoreductase [bacterium]